MVAGSRPEGPPRALFDILAPHVARNRVEVVLATSRPGGAPPDRPEGFREVRRPPGTPVPCLRSAGVEAASGRIVALTEDFCVPSPGWVDALLEAHRALAAIAIGGPVTRREGRAVDWALTFCEYGRFLGAAPSGPADDLPGINVSYKADRLRQVLGGVPGGIQEVLLHAELRRRGEAMWWVPEAVMEDVQRGAPAKALRAMFHHGRLYGGQRADGRPAAVRLPRTGLAPAVPLVLLSRILRRALLAGHGRPLLRSSGFLLLLLAAWALGEGAGSARGAGRSLERWT